MPRPRRLTEEEVLLWRAVAETVDVRQAGRLLPELATASAPRSSISPAAATAAQPVVPTRKPSRASPLTELDRRSRQKIVHGRVGIDRRIDLHGMTQAVAHAALRGFLRQAHADDVRLVLVVTGKGERPRFGAGETGVLKRLVPHWLSELDLRGIVLGFEQAGATHGGAGALYIRLRRRRDRS